MPEMDFKVLQNVVTLEQLCEELAKLQKQIRYIINGQIDFENVRARSIKAGNIETETLTASEIAANAITTAKIDAGAITTAKIAAGAVTADKITVTELSAITANMGTLTAGSITTNAEINVGTDATVGNNLYIGSNDPTSDSELHLNGATIKSLFGSKSLSLGAAGVISITSAFDRVVITADLNVGVNSQHGSIVDIVSEFDSTNSSISSLNSSVSSLSSSLSGKVSLGSSTSSYTQGNHNHGIPSGTQFTDTLGNVWTWAASGGFTHSHTV